MTANAKRAYKLQEFVAHSSNVNCLKIGRKTSRVLVTGGEDHRVNVWSIGKPNPLLSLTGHTSAVESVNFDSSEILVAAGTASGTIKLWDLQEEKVVRTLTGHRSNCISVDFHPFGEFFASGSLDTNLKIWDIRKKGCIHTYKGHTRGVNSIRFTPDGRWVVSGGEDNIVKLWDLTAGKLLHDFKFHEGQIQCMDFHPHEFLLATGSADKTVKFWDLETFELIGSAGPETSGVRSLTFNPDGRTLLCGLHENLKIFSWEPIRCHDTAVVGWSRLSDMNIHEGKLLGCSFNQSSVGVWVVDLSLIEPYAIASVVRPSSPSEIKSTSSGNLYGEADGSIMSNIGRLSVSKNSEAAMKETRPSASSGVVSSTQRSGTSKSPQKHIASSTSSGTLALKRSSTKTQPTNMHSFNKSDIIPSIVSSTGSKVESIIESRKETNSERSTPYSVHSKLTNFQKLSLQDGSNKEDNNSFGLVSNIGAGKCLNQSDISSFNGVPAAIGEKNLDEVRRVRSARFGANFSTELSADHAQENFDVRIHKPREAYTLDVSRGGRTRTPISRRESREASTFYDRSTSTSSFETMPAASISYSMRSRTRAAETETVSATDDDAIADLLELHKEFLSSSKSRLTKLQIVHRLWERNDVKGAINAMEKMSDNGVSADVVSLLVEKSDIVTLDVCTCLLPLLTNLLTSKIDRYLTISLNLLLKLVKVFGPVIHSAVSAPSSVGVDLEQEQRIGRCNSCFIELQKVKNSLPSLTRRGGLVMKNAEELNLVLQEVL